MEKKLNSKTEAFITTFKDHIRAKAIELEFAEKQKINDLIEYIYEYERLQFNKDDLSKRKRVNNAPENAKTDPSFAGLTLKAHPMVLQTKFAANAPKSLMLLQPRLWALFTTLTSLTMYIRPKTY
jgi:hypothetical protein